MQCLREKMKIKHRVIDLRWQRVGHVNCQDPHSNSLAPQTDEKTNVTAKDIRE